MAPGNPARFEATRIGRLPAGVRTFRLAPSGGREIGTFPVELWPCRVIAELIPMPDIQSDRPEPAPSILPGDHHSDLTDDQCLALLARAVEKHDPARLDEVAVLIGRLAVALE